MKKEIADRWVKALRSGRYKQARGHLAGPDGFCCLGVLCTVLRAKVDKTREQWVFEDVATAVLPRKVQKKAGMKTLTGAVSSIYIELSQENDLKGSSFKQIAEIIEQNWEQL